jgi:ribbon-helix-helix CopG family protein
MGRPKSNKQATRLTVTLEADDYDKVCALADHNDVSAAWIIRRAIQNYLRSATHTVPSSLPVNFEQDGGRV